MNNEVNGTFGRLVSIPYWDDIVIVDRKHFWIKTTFRITKLNPVGLPTTTYQSKRFPGSIIVTAKTLSMMQ